MKKLPFWLLVIICHQLKAQPKKISQAAIREFSQAVQAKYKTSTVFKANMDSTVQARYPGAKPLTVLRTMDKDTKVLDDVMDIVFRMEIGERENTTDYFRKLKVLPARVEELTNYCLYAIAEKDKEKNKEMTRSVDDVVIQVVPAERNEDEIYTVVEQPPAFKGGNDSLKQYLERSIRYPAEALEKKISGKVLVSFLINKTGKIEQVKTVGIIKGAGLEEEAMRIVAAMPDWNPGKQNNKPVLVQYILPVKFTLP